jgi:hypothetical protein
MKVLYCVFLTLERKSYKFASSAQEALCFAFRFPSMTNLRYRLPGRFAPIASFIKGEQLSWGGGCEAVHTIAPT